MANSKYGRLFTEKDVERIVSEALILQHSQAEVVRGIVERVDPGELTFPADEPLFLLRGQDRAAPRTLDAYAATCEELASPDAHVRSAEDVSARVLRWQVENPDRVKVPD